MTKPVALITGASARIGAEITRTLHQQGFFVAIHYRNSKQKAEQLKRELNKLKAHSAQIFQADFADQEAFKSLISKVQTHFNRLDVLINNASSFYSTTIESATFSQWDDLMAANAKAPFFLSQAAAPLLSKQQGCIVNLVDIHAFRPLKSHSIYSMAKAANAMLVKALARELGPDIRVNGVAPGAILWPETEMTDDTKQDILSRTALKRAGNATDISKTVLFLVNGSSYITGQIIAVDGGRTIQQ